MLHPEKFDENVCVHREYPLQESMFLEQQYTQLYEHHMQLARAKALTDGGSVEIDSPGCS